MRYFIQTKQRTENLIKIDVRVLKKNGFLKERSESSGCIKSTDWFGKEFKIGIVISMIGTFNRYMNLDYLIISEDESEEHFNYKVKIAVTPCNYGGYRNWFLCPLAKDDGAPCNKRVGILYFGGSYFGCRHCYNLAYRSNLVRYKITSEQDLEELWKSIGRFEYKGKETRKLRRWIKKSKVTGLAFEVMKVSTEKMLERVKRRHKKLNLLD